LPIGLLEELVAVAGGKGPLDLFVPDPLDLGVDVDRATRWQTRLSAAGLAAKILQRRAAAEDEGDDVGVAGIAHEVEGDEKVLARSGPQAAAKLLEEDGERERGAKKQNMADGRNIDAFSADTPP
jgi:hypothetical protein